MKKLTTGDDSTLKNWRDLTAAVFGDDSPATKFLDGKIAEQGEQMEVIADERQVLAALAHAHFEGETKGIEL